MPKAPAGVDLGMALRRLRTELVARLWRDVERELGLALAQAARQLGVARPRPRAAPPKPAKAPRRRSRRAPARAVREVPARVPAAPRAPAARPESLPAVALVPAGRETGGGAALEPDAVLPPGLRNVAPMEPAPAPPPAPVLVSDLERELSTLGPLTASHLRQLIAHRGRISRLAKVSCRAPYLWYSLRARFLKRADLPAIAHALDLQADGVDERADVECRRCGLHGHEVKDCDRVPLEHYATARLSMEAH